MMPLANLIGRLGGLTAILVGLALCAVVQQEVTGRPMAAPAEQRAVEVRVRPAAKVSGPPGTASLVRDVRATVTGQWAQQVRSAFGDRQAAEPDVHLVRVGKDGDWAFGTSAVAPPPEVDAMPLVSLFVAQRAGDRWQIALAGSADFAGFLQQAPEDVIPEAQRPLLEQYGAARDLPDRLALPWQVGQSWTVHPMSGMSGLRFEGGDGKVLASGAGRLYRLCTRSSDRGMILLIHPNGSATEYYQVADLTDVKDGSSVKQGDYLGRVSTDRPCGGPPARGRAAAGFTLLTGNDVVSLDGAEIGGWTLHADKGGFHADRSDMRIEPDNPLLNFGTDPTPSPTPDPRSS